MQLPVAAALLAVLVGSAGAQTPLIWTNSAQGGGGATIQAFDKATGARVRSFTGAQGNGRGIVVVGNVVYYTMTDEAIIHKMDATTGADLGTIRTAVSSMSTLAWDGSAFWTSDYAGTNRAFRLGLDGTTLSTISLSRANNYMDGVEWFNGKLISNRDDGGSVYDIYDLNGSLLQAGFITTPGGVRGTGIAYDGTNYYVSLIDSQAFAEFSGSTGAYMTTITATGYSYLYSEDLSVDYAGRADTGGGTTTPEPGTVAMLGAGVVGLGIFARRRRPVSA